MSDYDAKHQALIAVILDAVEKLTLKTTKGNPATTKFTCVAFQQMNAIHWRSNHRCNAALGQTMMVGTFLCRDKSWLTWRYLVTTLF